MRDHDLSLLKSRDLSYQKSGCLLLEKVGAEFPRGKLTVVLGPNGAGKSTLLKLVAGVAQPTGGSILWRGKSLKEFSPAELAAERAYLSQESVLSFPFRVDEVVALGASKGGRAAWETVGVSYLDVLGLEPFRQREYTSLSGGEKRRTHLARVLFQLGDRSLLAEKYLIVDEPLVGLDPRHQLDVMNLLQALAHENGLTVVCVLHDLRMAQRFADEVLLLNQGKLVVQGQPEAVLTPKNLNEVFRISEVI
jgi:iron complex transport system ATP-binding protein